ncbi:MAG: PTS system mannose/fructose/sorbose family transporter subunit IID [Candidatus Delongbacteria bacterium]|nr:PTS system mannose/fructose/sorbose family transporter subunit IID [Candidatus Delongbacteria bacterium]
MDVLTKKEILILTFRTFFIRLFYNYKNLFGVGICYNLLPVGKRSFCNDQNDKDFFQRHMSFFNTNVFLSGFAIGIIIKLEQSESLEHLERIKNTLSGTLGALGDNLINKTIMPLIIFASLNIMIMNGLSFDLSSLFFVLFLLLLFNIFNFSIRFYGISHGNKFGHKSLSIFKSDKYRTILKTLSYVRDILAGYLIVNLMSFLYQPIENRLNLLNLIFSAFLIFYFVKFLPVIYREVSTVITLVFYLIFFSYYL